MKIFRTVKEMQEFALRLKQEGRRIGLVPTMGALHEGHLTLMRAAKEATDFVIASVFVNPTQFGPNEDFDAYPRRFEEDCRKLESVGVDAVFHPQAADMYPQGFCTYVNVDGDITHKLCGAQRPIHFRGVATVVTKLFNIYPGRRSLFRPKGCPAGRRCLPLCPGSELAGSYQHGPHRAGRKRPGPQLAQRLSVAGGKDGSSRLVAQPAPGEGRL